MTEREKPCCAAAAAAKLQYLVIGGHRIAIAELDTILSKAREAEGQCEEAVRALLLKQVKVFNYVPPPAEKAYEDALYDECKRRKK
jgi:hypothetical protein